MPLFITTYTDSALYQSSLEWVPRVEMLENDRMETVSKYLHFETYLKESSTAKKEFISHVAIQY